MRAQATVLDNYLIHALPHTSDNNVRSKYELRYGL